MPPTLESRMAELERNHATLMAAVRGNAEIVAAINHKTDAIIEFFEAGQGAFRFLKLIGTIAKWFTTVAAALALFWLIIKGIK